MNLNIKSIFLAVKASRKSVRVARKVPLIVPSDYGILPRTHNPKRYFPLPLLVSLMLRLCQLDFSKEHLH